MGVTHSEHVGDFLHCIMETAVKVRMKRNKVYFYGMFMERNKVYFYGTFECKIWNRVCTLSTWRSLVFVYACG